MTFWLAENSQTAESIVWLTPRWLLDALGPFDLDPCAAPEGVNWMTAREHIRLPFDGLSAEWTGTVWLNPPYGKSLGLWAERWLKHGDGFFLCPARTDTQPIQDLLKAATACFLRGRVRFVSPDIKSTSPAFPSIVFAMGPVADKLYSLPGVVSRKLGAAVPEPPCQGKTGTAVSKREIYSFQESGK